MYDDIIVLDKLVNHKVLGGHWNQTVSRNAGTRIGCVTGVGTDNGTHIFHTFLVVGTIAAVVASAPMVAVANGLSSRARR